MKAPLAVAVTTILARPVPLSVIPLNNGMVLTGRNRVTFAGRNPRQQLT